MNPCIHQEKKKASNVELLLKPQTESKVKRLHHCDNTRHILKKQLQTDETRANF